MMRRAALLGVALSVLALDSARSADFFYENFSDAVRSIYGAGWAVFVPFTSMPAAADDPNRQAETYPGHLWNFGASTTSHGGTVYQQANNYCPGPVNPKPLVVGAAPFKDYQNLVDLKLTGDITIGPVKITALDAQYLKSVSVAISSVQRMYLPGFNTLKSAVKANVNACGSGYAYAVNGVLMGKVTISVAFNRSVDAGIAATISNSISFNLGAHAHVVQYGTADKPMVIQTDDAEIFAVQAAPLASLL